MRKVLLMDSGSGGLSVHQAVCQRLPDIDTIYLADFAALPYGTKSDSVIEQRMTGLLDYLIPAHQPDLIVIACNTASTLVLDTLRARFSQPFVGVVPAIKTAAGLASIQRIGVLVTPATASRDYVRRLIEQFAGQRQVSLMPLPGLVDIAERYIRGWPIQDSLQPILEGLRDSDAQAFVLGCTHFPLLRALLSEALPDRIWIDSGEAIARRVAHLLAAQRESLIQEAATASADCTSWRAPRHIALYTGEEDALWARSMKNRGFTSVERQQL